MSDLGLGEKLEGKREGVQTSDHSYLQVRQGLRID